MDLFVARLRVLAFVATTVSAAAAFAQTPPMVEIPQRLKAIEDQQAEIKAQLVEQRALLERLEETIAAAAAHNAAPLSREEAQAGAADDLQRPMHDDLAVSDTYSASARELFDCVKEAKAAAVPGASPATLTANCAPQKLQEIGERLQAGLTHSTEAYQNCRDLLNSELNGLGMSLPSNATELTSNQITDLKSQPLSQKAVECLNSLERVSKDVKDGKELLDTFAAMLSLAANACFANGGEPRVCAALYVLSIIANLLHRGGGGKGKGKGHDNGSTQGASRGIGPKSDERGGRPPAPPQERGSLDSSLEQTGLHCDARNGGVYCWTQARQQNGVLFKSNPAGASAKGRCDLALDAAGAKTARLDELAVDIGKRVLTYRIDGKTVCEVRQTQDEQGGRSVLQEVNRTPAKK